MRSQQNMREIILALLCAIAKILFAPADENQAAALMLPCNEMTEMALPRFLREKERVRHAGAFSLPPGMERYEIQGAGARAVRLFGGDRLRIVDPEGGQTAEIIACNMQGKCDAGLLNTAAHGRAEGFKKILARASDDRLAISLKKINFSVADAVSINRFDSDGIAGDEAVFVASDDAIVIVAAPGDDMAADGQNPPTSLLVFLERAAPVADRSPMLPEPRGDAAADFRIHRATAQAYLVKAGEWIQIIDVDGRQCTDFQAFAAASLDAGKERCLDPTASRSLSARAYPAPGLHAKYYDYDFQPLVEIAQDTCSRHDAFGLACNAKYYDDMGYPGHVNCSDNFNAALSPFGVQPRRGWMAMNFFFNTAIGDCGALNSDEPWSRPGDYVLLRALTDLVCVSSACPDDIDPANGWNPTDIHVRTYPKSLRARRSIWFRKRPDSEGDMTKETGFHSRTAALTREFAEYNGYWLPAGFAAAGALDEYWACREKAAAIDLSPLRKFEVVGPDAEALLQYCLTRDIRRLAAGQVVYAAMCYDTGGMIDDGTLFRLGDNNFRWVGGCDHGGEWLRKQAAALHLNARIKTSTDQLHNLSVQGPAQPPTLWAALFGLRRISPRRRKLNGFALLSADWGMSTVRRWCCRAPATPANSAMKFSATPKTLRRCGDAVMESGAPHGILPMGLTALDMLRVEAGLILQAMSLTTRPTRLRRASALPWPKQKRRILSAAPPCRAAAIIRSGRWSGWRRRAKNRPPMATAFMSGDSRWALSPAQPALRCWSKMWRCAGWRWSTPPTARPVEIGKLDGHQKRIPATVAPFPFYDPEKKKPRS